MLGDMYTRGSFVTNLMSTPNADNMVRSNVMAPRLEFIQVKTKTQNKVKKADISSSVSVFGTKPLFGASSNLMSSMIGGKARASYTKTALIHDLFIGLILFGVFLGVFMIVLNTDYDKLSRRLQAFMSPDSYEQNQRIPQAWLTRYSISAVAQSDFTDDIDGDGLTLEQEYQYLTNPISADTDGDGVSDGQEIIAKTNPLGKGVLDVNGDGVVD